MGVSSPVMALDSIRKAAKWEPNKKYLPRYLCLQAELEIGFGDKDKALQTIKDAKNFVNENRDFWYSGSHNDIINRIDDALKELNN